MRAGAVALDPAGDGRAGEALLADALDDRLVERLPVPGVGLADEDPDELAVALEAGHTARPEHDAEVDRDEAGGARADDVRERPGRARDLGQAVGLEHKVEKVV